MATTASSTFTPSWHLVPRSIELFRKNFVMLLYLSILPSLVVTLGNVLVNGNAVISKETALGYMVMAVGFVWSIATYAAFFLLQVRATTTNELHLSEIYRESIRFLPRVFGLQILTALLFVGGLILFIVPGLIVLRRYYLATYYLVDQDLSIREAMRKSADESKKPVAGYIWGIIGVSAVFSLIGGIISIPGGVGIGELVGTLFAYLYLFASALRYREIRRFYAKQSIGATIKH